MNMNWLKELDNSCINAWRSYFLCTKTKYKRK